MAVAQPQSTPASVDVAALAARAREASDFLKALAHRGRLLILCLLVDGERSVTDLERLLELRQPTVSQQLARLRAEGLVKARREGKTIFYSLADEKVARIIGALHSVFCADEADESAA
jgi:DNA-binding transcriptional ArsR family regulator